MYGIADGVARWLSAGMDVTVIRVAQLTGIANRERAEAVAAVPGQPWIGTVLGGALDRELASVVGAGPPRMIDLEVGEQAARDAGLACGGTARVLVQSARELPTDTWRHLMAHEPLCLVTSMSGQEISGQEISGLAVGPTELLTQDDMADAGPVIRRLFHAGVSRTTIEPDAVITTLWPPTTLVIVGSGAIADALVTVAAVAGWRTEVVDDADTARDLIAGLTRADGVIVLSHDRSVDGPALAAALAARPDQPRPGYIGALGSRRTQGERAQWLAVNGIRDPSAIRGPAGLDIGAHTPAEMAISIVAEMLSVRNGAPVVPLSARTGPIHD